MYQTIDIDGVGPRSDREIGRMMFFLPLKMNRVLRDYLSDPCLEVGLKEYHIPVMSVIYYCDGASQKGIRSLIPYDKSRISVVVNELIIAGMVRDTGKGRTSCLHLTDRGNEVLDSIREHTDDFFKTMYSSFPDRERASILSAYVHLDQYLDGFLDKGDALVCDSKEDI